MTVIPFSEVVQGTNTDTEAEQRLLQKEAIYQGLIEEQARVENRPLEEVILENEAEDQVFEATTPELTKQVAEKKGISVYEYNLDMKIGSLRLWNKHFSKNHPKPLELVKG